MIWTRLAMMTTPHSPTGLARYHSAMRSRRVRGTLGPASETRSMDVPLMTGVSLSVAVVGLTVISPPSDRLEQSKGEGSHPHQTDEPIDGG